MPRKKKSLLAEKPSEKGKKFRLFSWTMWKFIGGVHVSAQTVIDEEGKLPRGSSIVPVFGPGGTTIALNAQEFTEAFDYYRSEKPTGNIPSAFVTDIDQDLLTYVLDLPLKPAQKKIVQAWTDAHAATVTSNHNLTSTDLTKLKDRYLAVRAIVTAYDAPLRSCAPVNEDFIKPRRKIAS